MKNKIVIALIMVFPLMLTAQSEAVTYGYDNAGNRIYRDVIVLMIAEEKDSTLQEELLNTNDILANDNSSNSNNNSATKEESSTPTIHSKELDGVKLELYPNPTTGSIVVNVPNFEEVNQGLIRVSDLTGKLLIEEKVTSSSTNIDLSPYKDGSYILFLNINGKINEWKVVKQR